MENVVFGPFGQCLPSLVQGGDRAFAVVDCAVAERFAPVLDEFGVEWMAFRASEERKSFEGLQEIAGWLLEHEADRGALLLGIGGGVTTDLTGFAASVYKRGIRYALVPTTLLAQVDAAVGGKTGIDFHGCKNVIGTFSMPEAVCVDTAVLASLPREELRSGMAEALKTLVIGDAAMYREAVERMRGGMERIGDNELSALVRRCVGIKSGIVAADRTEKGERMKLNLGHTLGHAAESVCLEAGRPVTHGEAVAAGIIAAAAVSWKKGVLDRSLAESICNDLKSLGYSDIPGLLSRHAGLREEEIAPKLSEFVLNDKKRNKDFINFVLIRGLGSVMAEVLDVNELQGIIHDLY